MPAQPTPGPDSIQARVRLYDQLASGQARQLRRRAGVPLHELATILRTTPTTVYRWEHGQRRPRDIRVVVRYVNALVAMESALARVGIGPEDLDGEQQPAGA